MPNVNMIPGWGQAILIKVGTSQYSIPVIQALYDRNDGRRIEMTASGNAQNAYPSNSTKAPNSSLLTLSARAFDTWFGAAILNSLFVTRDANGDLVEAAWKVGAGTGTAVDAGKGMDLTISSSAGRGDLAVNMRLLGKAAGSAATFTPYVHQSGSPFYHKGVSMKWTPAGGSEATLELVEDFSLNVATGVTPGKWFDGGDGMSNIDQGIQSGSLVIMQRAGAELRMDAAEAGTLAITMAPAGTGNSVTATLQLVRLTVGRPIDPMAPGGVKIPSTWALLSSTGANPIAFSNPAA